MPRTRRCPGILVRKGGSAMSGRLFSLLAVAAVVLVAAAVAGAAHGRAAADIYTVHALVSDNGAVPAAATDASLVNGWGLSAGPTTPWWASDNGTNTSTLYTGTGAKQALTVSVAGAPTGTVFNGNAADFAVSQSGKTRCGTVPVLDRGRHDSRLDAVGEQHGRRRRGRPFERRRRLQGSRDRNRSPVRHGLPQRTRRRLRRVVQPGHDRRAASRTRRSRRASHRSASRRSAATSS